MKKITWQGILTIQIFILGLGLAVFALITIQDHEPYTSIVLGVAIGLNFIGLIVLLILALFEKLFKSLPKT